MTSVYKVEQGDAESFTLVTHPFRSYVSSSVGGSTGAVHVFARRSHSMKDAAPDPSFVEATHDDGDYASLLLAVQQQGRVVRTTQASSASAFAGMMEQYLVAVNTGGQQRRLQQQVEVIRFSPPPAFNSNTLRKLFVKDTLQSYYRTSYPSAHWAYTNYNTLNFFTASTCPTSSVLLYPNVDGGSGGLVFHEGHCSGTYTPSGSFTFDFYVNPRYTSDSRDGQFRAGTILHLSSTYALSLVSGSSKDPNGRPQGFRLQLQLSRSADIPPSWIKQDAAGGVQVSGPAGSYDHVSASALPPSDLVFLSTDNALWLNRWHHVVVRWGTRDTNAGRGTFNVDGRDVGTFDVPSSSITPSLADIVAMGVHNPPVPGITQLEPAVLCVGNFFEGPNHSESPQAAFFAADPALRDGLNVLLADTGVETPASYSFDHPLNAELHDLAIRRCYVSDDALRVSASVGPTYLDNTYALYVPPFFVTESPYRRFVGDRGGVMVTPFEEVDGATASPFNVALSFGVAGHCINLENFVRDFASNVFPLLHHLTGVAITTTTPDVSSCNAYLYSQPFVVKRNLTILPCDDGLFVPSFQLLASESTVRAVDDMGIGELSFVNLGSMVMSSTLMFAAGSDDAAQGDPTALSFVDQQLGSTPESPFSTAGPATANFLKNAVSGSDVESAAPLTVFQRTQDASSNQITVFDVSNLYYGMRIKPNTFVLSDADIVRSSFHGAGLASLDVHGPVRITLADDGRGNLYRADCLTSQSSWNSVGNVYYDEGLAVVKSPHVYFFGEDAYALDLRGEQHVHVMRIDALAPNNQLNSSSNPGFRKLRTTGRPNESDEGFVYVSGVNFHDRDLNVVMKSQLAQPIMKRHGDRISFRIKYDF